MLTLAQDHISLTRKERAFYKDQCAKSKTEIEKHFSQSDGSLCLTVPLYDIPASRDMSLHISFDYAQQVQYDNKYSNT